MNYLKCKRIVKKYLPKLQKIYALDDWVIHVKYKAKGKEGNEQGECQYTSFKYKEAVLLFYYKTNKTEEELITCIKHELGHIFHSGFEELIINRFDKKYSKDMFFQDILSILYEEMATRLSRIRIEKL